MNSADLRQYSDREIDSLIEEAKGYSMRHTLPFIHQMPLYPSDKDIAIFRRWNNEIFGLHFTQKKFYKLRTDLTDIDELWGESETPVFDGPYLVHAYVHLTPELRALDKFGLDERRQLMVTLARDRMDELNLRPDIGDVIVLFDDEELDKTEYEVMEAHLDAHYGNTGHPIHWILTCNIRQQSSVKDSRVDTTINVPDEEVYP